MTERLADISARLHGVEQLGAVISAMRGMAASRARQSRSATAGVRAYADVVASALADALPLLDVTENRKLPEVSSSILVVVGPEQGFVGGMADRMLGTVAAGHHEVFVVGSRLALLADARGIPMAWQTPQASHPDGVPAVATRVADALFARLQRGDIDVVEVAYPVWAGPAGAEIYKTSMVPLDRRQVEGRRSTDAPLTTLAPNDLVAQLTEEYVHAGLCEAMMLAFSAENEARVVTMAAAKTNVDILLTQLAGRERNVRQAEITSEVIELAAGSALIRKRRKG